MSRRTLLAGLGAAGLAGTAGLALGRSETTLSDPTVHADSGRRRSLRFSDDGREIGSLGVTGYVGEDSVELQTEIWHRDGTDVDSIALRVWTPPAREEPHSDVAVLSPVEGDSSPPPEVTLSTPRREPGTLIEVSDLDDLADETISTLELIVRPRSSGADVVAIDATIELDGGGWLATDYTLDGRLDLEFPDLASE